MANKVTEEDTTKTYKFLPVSDNIHRELSILKAKEQLTFDEIVDKLINFYKANN